MTVSILLTFLVVSLTMYSKFNGYMHDSVREEAEYIRVAIEETEGDYLNEKISSLKSDNRITLLNTDGTVLYDSLEDASAMGNHGNRPEVKEAEKKGLCVVCGNQRRYDNRYQDLVKRMQDGEIGELLAGQCYWNNGSYIGAWANGKEGTEDTLEYQIRNWWCFIWASGDNIVEQHVHNIDVLMWAFGSDRMPVEVTTGLGGRSTDLPCPRYGDRFSHFAIDYDMGNGLRMASYCHQDPNTTPNVSERIVGTKGIFQNLRFTDHKGKTLYAPGKLELDPYIAEHKYLLSAIRSGRRVNELKNLVNSNMVAIAGRMSAFSGKRFKYDWMVKKSEENIVPQNVDLMGKTQDLSLKNPVSVPVPGKYKLV